MSGHAFFCDTPDHVLQELRTAVGKQGSSINPGEKLSFERHALSPSQESHLRFFREAHAQRIQELKKTHKLIPAGVEHLLADLDHIPDDSPQQGNGRALNTWNNLERQVHAVHD